MVSRIIDRLSITQPQHEVGEDHQRTAPASAADRCPAPIRRSPPASATAPEGVEHVGAEQDQEDHRRRLGRAEHRLRRTRASASRARSPPAQWWRRCHRGRLGGREDAAIDAADDGDEHRQDRPHRPSACSRARTAAGAEARPLPGTKRRAYRLTQHVAKHGDGPRHQRGHEQVRRRSARPGWRRSPAPPRVG